MATLLIQGNSANQNTETTKCCHLLAKKATHPMRIQDFQTQQMLHAMRMQEIQTQK